jgi:hypothetical protein
MNNIWINIAIAIIQTIIVFAVGYWQISVAKSIARNEIGKKLNLKTTFRAFFSKHSKKLTILAMLLYFSNVYFFIKPQSPPSRFDVLLLVFLTSSALILLLSQYSLRMLELMKQSHEILYCMICKRSEKDKPVCIEKINELVLYEEKTQPRH